MDIRMMLDPDDRMRKELEELGINDDPDSQYEIRRRDKEIRYLPGRKEEQQFFISVDDICFIESMGHTVLIHSADGIYTTTERLKSLEVILDQNKFIRVSNSAIVNLKKVKRIESSIMQKFILHMSNGKKVDVTRSYYYIFRDRLGI